VRILREPLLHFFVLGALVYGAASYFDDDSSRYRIDAGPDRRARIEATYREQYGIAPTPQQVGYLLDQYVRSEILYREGLALGLERDDEIVRRRVVQKIEFVNEDLEVGAQPERGSLIEYFQQHRARYETAPRVSFTQVFFCGDRGGEATAKARAGAALASGPSPSAPGDLFAEGSVFKALSRIDTDKLFGESELSTALFTAPVGAWSGPFKSAFGWHLVRIDRSEPAQAVTLQSVELRVKADYLADLRARRNAQEFRKIAGKYQVVGGPT
jgi:hypothetical protein